MTTALACIVAATTVAIAALVCYAFFVDVKGIR